MKIQQALKSSDKQLQDLIVANPDYYIPVINTIRNNLPVRLVFLVCEEEPVVMWYKRVKRKYCDKKSLTKYGHEVAGEAGFYSYSENYYTDYFDVKDLEVAKSILSEMYANSGFYLKDKIIGKCEWTSLSNFYNFQMVYPDLERYIYEKDKALLYLVDNVVPHSVYNYSGEFDHIFKNSYGGPEPYTKPVGTQYPLKNYFGRRYKNLTQMFEALEQNKDTLFDSYLYCNSLPVTSCLSITLDELKKFETKLEGLYLCNFYQGGSKGRDGEYYSRLKNLYSDLHYNRNFPISNEIHSYLKTKKSVDIEVYDSDVNESDYHVHRNQIYSVVTLELKNQLGIDRSNGIAPFVYPAINLPKQLLAPFEREVSFPDNFHLTFDYTLENINDFSLRPKSSILRPFFAKILDEDFIYTLSVRLINTGLESKKWYKKFMNTSE